MCASTFWRLRFSSTITRTLSTLLGGVEREPGGAEREPGCDDADVGVGTEPASRSVQEASPDSKAATTTATAGRRHRAQALARLATGKTCIASAEFSCRSLGDCGRLSEAPAGANEGHNFLLLVLTDLLPRVIRLNGARAVARLRRLLAQREGWLMKESSGRAAGLHQAWLRDRLRS
jgi:hypothetical protein